MGIISAMLAASTMVACPSSISDSQKVAGVSGWQVVVHEAKRKLEYASVFSGHPSRLRSLQPQKMQPRSQKPGKYELTYVWGTGTEDIWVECHYRQSAAVLVRKVGAVRRCTLTKDIDGNGTATCERR